MYDDMITEYYISELRVVGIFIRRSGLFKVQKFNFSKDRWALNDLTVTLGIHTDGKNRQTKETS